DWASIEGICGGPQPPLSAALAARCVKDRVTAPDDFTGSSLPRDLSSSVRSARTTFATSSRLKSSSLGGELIVRRATPRSRLRRRADTWRRSRSASGPHGLLLLS